MHSLEGFPNLVVQDFQRQTRSHFALNTTVRCQHRCIYCFEGDREGKADIAAEETKRLIDAAVGKVQAVIFMGAEPTMNPALPELVAHARSRGLAARLSTNALRLADYGYLARLREAGLGDIELSFHYPDEKVYSHITKARPEGFHRILQAIGNIARMNRESPPERRYGVAVNIVISRHNVERLDEILALVLARLDGEPLQLKLKHLDFCPPIDEAMVRDLYVPCSVLRRELPAFAARIPPGGSLGLDRFPLCAIPGLEPLEINLGYWLNDVDFSHNFTDQQRVVRDTTFEEGLSFVHPFDWVCEQCGLAPLCNSRVLFRRALPDQPPVPLLGPVPERLRALVREQARGEAVWARPPRATLHGWLLARLREAVPPERPLPGTQVRWAPAYRGELRLSEGGASARFQLPSPDRLAQGRFAPLFYNGAGAAPAWATRGIAALEAALRSLPPPPRLPVAEDTR